MSSGDPHYIIAIGASVGGMEEINSFFDHTPMDDVSYIVIRHLSPDFKSRMVELLAKHSKLVVEQAENRMGVKSNRVYLIPGDKFMTIRKGKLYLTNKKNISGPHHTIDKFFISLAKDYGNKAIGVVLSGLGPDGAEGIKAIKKAGGMVIARNPATSEFGSMPAHAIATGLVDFVFEPEQIPIAIENYIKQEGDMVAAREDEDDYFRSNINGQLVIDNELRLIKFSPAAAKQINLADADIGRPLSDISTDIKFETIIPDLKQVLSRGDIITKEIETDNGKWYQMMAVPYVQRADKKRDGAIITFNDITELKKIQQELDVSNKMLGIAIDSAEMGIWYIDVKTREFKASPGLKALFGFGPDEEMTYEAAIAQIDSKYQSLVTDAVEASINKGERFDLEYPLRRVHEKKLRWVSANGNLTHDKEGKPRYFTGVVHDVTLHKEDEIRKNDFIAMVSHELRTPLTCLQAYVQMLAAKAKKEGDAFAVLALGKANRQVKKMTTLINGFLSASSFESGKIYLNEQSFEISALLNEIVEDAALTGTTSHNIVLFPGPPLTVYADMDKIGQVINNFLSNAVKYSPKGKNIEVFYKEVEGTVQVGVKDEGIGISVNDQQRLFDRFHRIESAQTQHIPGFGLGLYLSAEIVKRHKGNVWVESELGRGATFYFSLPLVSSS